MALATVYRDREYDKLGEWWLHRQRRGHVLFFFRRVFPIAFWHCTHAHLVPFVETRIDANHGRGALTWLRFDACKPQNTALSIAIVYLYNDRALIQRIISFCSTDGGDVKYLCVKLGISSQEIDDRPAIGSLIKSVLPSASWIEHWMEHYFVIPKDQLV
jgi:hypothetical protein